MIQGLATCAGMSAVFPAALSLPASVPAMRFNKVLYDERTTAGLAFAAEARRLGADVHAVKGDVTKIWFDELQPQWQATQVATAGLTDFNSWFVLDLMARDAGMRTVYLAHHESTPYGHAHRQFGPLGALEAPLGSASHRWGRQSAGILMHFPSKVSVSRDRSSILEARNREISRAALVSWIIARPQAVRS
jgi:hypothetical protein